MARSRFTLLLGLTFAQVAVGSFIATLVVSNMTTAASLPTGHPIAVGPGFTDVSPHQLVRTGGDILYAVAPSCDSYPSCPGNSLRVYRADRPGTPASFAEQDAAHRPAGGIGSSAIAIDGTDTIHALWNDRSGTVRYATFATGTNLWSSPIVVAAANWTDFGQGDEGVALALDSSGTPHAAWSAKGGDGALHAFSADRGGGWSAQQVDDVPLTGNRRVLHPTIAFTANDSLVVAWLEGTFNYAPDGVIHVRTRSSAGAWGATETVNDPEGAMTTIDNGPSLLITPDGTEHIAFVAASPADQVRYWYNSGAGWQGDRQPPAQVTHDPSLGPDGGGGVYIYGHGTPTPVDGHGDNLYTFHKAAGGAWEPWTLYATGSYDSSVTTRWAQFFQAHPEEVDIAYWADAYPNTLYVGTAFVATPPTPTGLHASSATSTSVTFSWTNPDPTANVSASDGTSATPLTAGTSSFTRTGVALGSYVCLSVSAWNGLGSSAWSPFTCGLTVPLMPTGLHVSDATNTGVSFAWSDPDSHSAIAVGMGTTGSTIYTGLVPGTTTNTKAVAAGYWACAQVAAYNASYASTFSPWVCGLALPNAPTGIHVTGHTPSSVTFGWTDSDPYSGLAVSNGSAVSTVAAGGTAYTQRGMATNSWVCISLAAYNSSGASPWTAASIGWICGQAT